MVKTALPVPNLLRRLRRQYRMGRAYISPERNFSLSKGELLKGLFEEPNVQVGAKRVEGITENGEHKIVRIKGVKSPLYWPTDLHLSDLYRVIAECFDESDWQFYEVPETRVDEGDTVLDCGASEGIFSLRVLERAHRIAAFEPSPPFVKSLHKTFGDHPKVSVVPMALGEREGEAFLEGDSLYGHVDGNAKSGVPIRITTVDGWAEQAGGRVDYIKADIEGFEMEMLQGAASTIRRDKPKIAITTYHPGNDWQAMANFLRELVPEYQYRIKGLAYKGGVRPVMLHLWIDNN
jgi:FkbM family methyltransferase